MSSENCLLGVDVGGTFTDLTLLRLPDGEVFHHKLPSTPADSSESVAAGIRELLEAAAIPPSAIAYFGHGTTVATNALLESRTAKTGLITTEGFRDIIEIRRQRQPHNYDIRMPKPPPLVPRYLRREVAERTYLREFRPSTAPGRKEVDAILEDFRREGVEAVAVCFLHSYENPGHEELAASWVRERFPEAFVCTSSEVLAEFREYERTSTTVINASLGPVMSQYLNRLETRAEGLGLAARPHILQSNGGVISAAEAGRRPVRLLASGPAAGVIGAVHLSGQAGFEDVITFDAGGTSTEVCLVERGEPLLAQEKEVGGHPVRFPSIDVHSVGAGGGSIARVDEGGFLHVGPESAGADPGPACYGRGGAEATVTDANVVLGRLHPEHLLGGRMPIQAGLACEALEEKVARPMGLSLEDAALGVLTILNENLCKAIRVISVERGFDPRRFALVAFGGAGPLLAAQLAGELGLRTVLVPAAPGLLCAGGLLAADIRRDFSLTRIMELVEAGANGLNDVFEKLERDALSWLDAERIPREQRALLKGLDMRYLGQSHELRVNLPEGALKDGADFAKLADAFRAEHERMYGYAPDSAVEAVTFRMSALARLPKPSWRVSRGAGSISSGKPSPAGSRRAFFRKAGGFADTPVYRRADLPPGCIIDGPAIVEQIDTTTIVLPGQRAASDKHGNLVLSFEEGAGRASADHFADGA